MATTPRTYEAQRIDSEWNAKVGDMLGFLDSFQSGSRDDKHEAIAKSQRQDHGDGLSMPRKPSLYVNHSIGDKDLQQHARKDEFLTEEARKEAEETRQQAREWANKMRAAVFKWLDDDQRLTEQYKTEEHHANEAYRHAIAKLEDKVHHLEQELKTSLNRYLEGEEALHQIIRDQKCRIASLERQLEQKSQSSVHSTSIPQTSDVEIKEKVEMKPTKTLEDEPCTPRLAPTSKPNPAMTPGERSVPVSPDSEDSSSDSEVDTRQTRRDNPRTLPSVSFSFEPDTTNSRRGPVPRPPISQAPVSALKGQQRPRRRHLRSPRGHPIIQYGNGATKETQPDGTEIIRFPNGDIQITQGDVMAYYYSSSDVFSVRRPDASILWEFPDGQLEQHYPNGERVVLGTDEEPPQDHVLLMAKELRNLEHLDLLTFD